MLLQLRIVDLVTIEEVELSPCPGLNVLTGETGAGKSIIVGAAGLLRGGRASADMVRAGCKEAVVEALFDVTAAPEARQALEAAGLPLPAGGELLVRRQVAASGRGRVHVNGALSTASVLAGITCRLLDISGQHEHLVLADRATHRQLLDACGVPAELLAQAQSAYRALRDAARDLACIQMDERERCARMDFLRFQLVELDEARLAPGEDVRLELERARLLRASELIAAAEGGVDALYSAEDAVASRIGRLGRQLEALGGIEPQLGGLAAQLAEARVIVEDVATTLRGYAGGIEIDPARLQQIEERLDLLHKLRRKHGSSVDEILARRREMQQELQQMESLEQRVDSLAEQLSIYREAARQAAEHLTRARAEAAELLSRRVSENLAGLRLADARLDVAVQPQPLQDGDDEALSFDGRKLGPAGWDRVELLIATNPGEPPRPLARVASGGELSRVMLALRQALGEHDPVTTSIYDEVDAGIGGAVADVVGRSLAEVAQHRQVLCVTHLPQVAAHADAHFYVGKKLVRRRVKTTVRQLEEEERVEELARMLGAAQVTPEARANARRLLASARGSEAATAAQ